MTEVRQAFCPVCGVSHGTKVTETVEGKPYIVLARGNFWEKKNWDSNKPFGSIQETLGRGTFKFLGYFQPEEDIDGYYPLVKDRLLSACKEWIDKGWLTREELEEAIG